MAEPSSQCRLSRRTVESEQRHYISAIDLDDPRGDLLAGRLHGRQLSGMHDLAINRPVRDVEGENLPADRGVGNGQKGTAVCF
jgi:hypothetical protein